MKHAKKFILVEEGKPKEAQDNVKELHFSPKIKHKRSLMKKMKQILNDKKLDDNEKLKLYNMISYQNVANELNLKKDKDGKQKEMFKSFIGLLNKTEKQENDSFAKFPKFKSDKFSYEENNERKKNEDFEKLLNIYEPIKTSTPNRRLDFSSDSLRNESDEINGDDDDDDETLRNASLYSTTRSLPKSPVAQNNLQSTRVLRDRSKKVDYGKQRGGAGVRIGGRRGPIYKKWSFLNP